MPFDLGSAEPSRTLSQDFVNIFDPVSVILMLFLLTYVSFDWTYVFDLCFCSQDILLLTFLHEINTWFPDYHWLL